MYKLLSLLAISLLLLSCGNSNKHDSQNQSSTTKEEPVIGRNNYAVVWNWTTTDKQLVDDNTLTISKELTKLWNKGIVENAYYDGNAKVDKFEHFPNIIFFLKAKSFEEAEVILNKLTIVKKGIAVYTVYPVGTKWLGRNDEIIKEKAKPTKSFVAVWTTNKEVKPSDELTKSQSDAVLKLWNEAVIENVYFDIEGIQKANNETDFVFFVNANSKEEVKQIVDNLPFAKENIASYKLLSVGSFWMGVYEDSHKN
jgi:hypothetical protein